MNANVGMLHPVAATVATYTKGTGITYTGGTVIAGAKSASLQWERSDGEFYGDDILLDTDNGITGYTLDFEPTGLTDAARALLLGEVANTGTTSNPYTITDAPSPDVGFGYIRKMRATGNDGTVSYSFEGWWFYKLKFGLGTEETQTKEKNIEWRTPTLNGKGTGVVLTSSGAASFAVHETFTIETSAITWLNTQAGIS